MEHPTVNSAVRVISESVAQLPFGVFRREDDGSRTRLRDHPVDRLFSTHGRPNDWMSAFEMKELLTRQVAIRGNGYAFKNVVGEGRLRELLPMHPKRVEVEQNEDWRITYTVNRDQKSRQILTPRQVFHLRGPSDNGFTGVDIVAQMRDAIGLALAQDRDAAKIFANGARIANVLEHPGTLTPETADRIKQSFNEIYSGIENSHKTAVLEEGMKLSKAGMTAEERQSLESRKLSRSILASIWRIPPHMVGDLERATFSNIEDLARQFVDYALVPWLNRWEQAIEQQLFSEQDRADGLIAKFDARGLLRGDAQTRAEFYASGITNRWMNPNEVREKEDLPPYEGGERFANPAIEPSGGEDADTQSNAG